MAGRLGTRGGPPPYRSRRPSAGPATGAARTKPAARHVRRLFIGWFVCLSAVLLSGLMVAVSPANDVLAGAGLSPLRAGHGTRTLGSSRGSGPPGGQPAASPHSAFGMLPGPQASGRSRAYFRMNLAAGSTGYDSVLLVNDGAKQERLLVSPSTGVTAANGGTAYISCSRRCPGPGRWLHGLAAMVTLPPAGRDLLNFSVTVPQGTPPGQYLAGVSAQPARKARPVAIGRRGRATTRAVIIDEVIVGVAVTVGAPASLGTRLRIAGVLGAFAAQVPRLEIDLRNDGQTFAGATGTASCAMAGKHLHYRVSAGTVLPHQGALIPVNAPGMRSGGNVYCTVRLRYGNGIYAKWSGIVRMPAGAQPRIVRTGPGTYSLLPPGGIPGWAIGLMVLGLLILAALSALLVRGRYRSALPGPAGAGNGGRAGVRGTRLDGLLGRRGEDSALGDSDRS